VPGAGACARVTEVQMITQETAALIWNCYREIAAGEKLLADMAEEAKNKEPWSEKKFGTLRDAFGHERQLQLGIPSGENGHRLFRVSPSLAEAVIVSHIAHVRAELVEANAKAGIELQTPAA
jgi:hypothetical protein